jgi:hippurate hydrolase
VSRAFAIHLDPSRRAHAVEQRAGTMLAAFDDFEVTFRGAGGHASTPHAAVDPIPAIGPFVDGLSHVAAREMDPDDRAVLSVTIVRAGTADNVIPAEAKCVGTIRSLSVHGRRRAHERLRRVAEGVAASRGLGVDVEISEGYPPSVNDRGVIDLVTRAAHALELPVHEMPSPFMGAEDFAYVLERVPGALVFLGCRTEGGAPLHSDRMRIDESVLATGAALHAMVALRMLEAASRG